MLPEYSYTSFTVILSTRLPSISALQPTCLCACLVHWSHPPTRSIYIATDHLIFTQNTQHLRGNNNLYNKYGLFALLWDLEAQCFSQYVFIYMLNTRVSQWCKQIKLKENTCLFISTKLLRKTGKSPNLEPYVVLVSYTLWCFSFFISEAVLLSLEDFPLFFPSLVEYLWTCRNSQKVWIVI